MTKKIEYDYYILLTEYNDDDDCAQGKRIGGLGSTKK